MTAVNTQDETVSRHLRTVGDLDFAVADLSLAEFGRKEIRLAEHEMPGLMAFRREYAEVYPLRGARISAAELMVACRLRAYCTAPASGMSGAVLMYSLALVSEMRGALSIAAVSLST